MNRQTLIIARAACARAWLETQEPRFLDAYHDLFADMVAERRVETDLRPMLLVPQAG